MFYWRKVLYFVFTYIFPLVSLFISQFQIHNLELARWFLLTLKHYTLVQIRQYRLFFINFELCNCGITKAKQHINKYIVLQCSKLFYCKVSSGFLRQNSQSSYSFGIIQNAGVKKKLRVSMEKNSLFRFQICFPC